MTMKLRLGSFTWIVLWAMAGSALAQSQVQPSRNTDTPNPVRPDQPIQSNAPTLQPRVTQPSAQMQTQQQVQAQAQAQQQAQPQAQQQAQAAVPQPTFTLNPQEKADVDRILKQWEEHNKTITTFDCRFKRWIYDALTGKRDEKGNLLPSKVETGVLSYGSPDRGLFHVCYTVKDDNKEEAIDPMREEHWVCNGKSIFEYNHAQRQLIEHQLPPNLQGKAISDTPLPFLFGSDAQKLDQRYWIKNITPPGIQGQIILEAWPKFQQEAANFHFAKFIIDTKNNTMYPKALQLVMPNGKDSTSYEFYEVDVNVRFHIFGGNPFQASTPFNWKKIVEPAVTSPEAQQPQAQAQQSSNDRR
jgi:TIGR03009 family protein